MILDNSAVTAWSLCPLKFFEQFVDKRSARLAESSNDSLDFGSRFHELLEAHYSGKPAPDCPASSLEDEAQATLAAYIAYYPVEDFEVVETEKVHVLEIPNSSHRLAIKMDMLTRAYNDRRLRLLDTKTERRGSQANSPESWASRRQVGLYQWGVSQVYHEDVQSIIVNIVTRASEKGRVSPAFSRWETYRTADQISEALRYVSWVGDQIERALASGYFPANRDACKDGWKLCDFYRPHLYGWTDSLRAKYLPAEDYLGLEKLDAK